MLVRARRSLFFVAILSCASACASAQPSNQMPSIEIATQNIAAEEVVRKFATEYNNQNLEGMMALVSDEIQWLSIEQDKSIIVTNGIGELRAELDGFFTPESHRRSDVIILSSHGDFVTTLERAYSARTGNSQASFATYEVIDNAILRVWYFPAQP